nr:hypothetical protein [uncultured Kingella sp.]
MWQALVLREFSGSLKDYLIQQPNQPEAAENKGSLSRIHVTSRNLRRRQRMKTIQEKQLPLGE